MKKIVSFTKAALCSAAGIFIMTGCTNFSKMLEEEPQEYVSLAAENTAEAMVADSFSEEYRLFDQALKNGSVYVEFEAEGIKFSGECYVNEKDEMSSQMYTITGSKGTSAQLYAFADKNTMKLGTIGNSGTHIYSFDMNTLEEKLKTSIFNPDSGSEYAMDESDYEMFLEYAAELNSAITGTKDKNSRDDISSKYDEMIKTFLEENVSETSEKVEVTINGETVSANIVKYDFSKAALRDMTEKFISEVMEDEAILEQAGDSKEDMEKAKSEILSGLDELDDFNIQLVYYVNSASNQLMEIDANIKWAEKPVTESYADDDYGYYGASWNDNAAYDISVSVVYGADPANSEKQKIQIDYSVDYYENDYLDDSSGSILAEITKSETKTETVITMTSDGETMELLTLTAEKNGDNYTVSADIPELGATAGMTGTIVTEKDSFTMTIDRLFLNYGGSTEMSYLPKAVISVKKGGELLNLDAEKEFLDITEEEFDVLLENISDDFEAAITEFAEDSVLGKSMLNYIDKSKRSAANAYAKTAYTAIATKLVQMEVDGEEIESEIVTGVGSIITIDGKDKDLTDYLLGNEGYIYAEIKPYAYAINYALWSEEPIPEQYKHQLSYDDEEALMDEGIFIGCYPLGSSY